MVVSVNPYSDGDPTHRPNGSQHLQFDPDDGYLEKLATLWMEHRTEKKPGMRYFLDHLPAGYCVYGRPRVNNPQHIDKWCYGHPDHKSFDSPNRFFPHFLHLMENGTNGGCPCTVCMGSKSALVADNGAGLMTVRPSFKLRGRATLTEAGKVDEEGNPDVYRNLIDKLKCFGTLDTLITEPMSMDWRAERRLLHDSLQTISQQPAWLPRVAELVLFVRNIDEDEEITVDHSTKHYRIWNTTKQRFTGYPRWEAGVIAQAAEEKPTIAELVRHPNNDEKMYNINYAGYRVEPFPDPNGRDKSISKRHKYISLDQIRPLAFFNDLIKGIPATDWDQTIGNAITVMSTVSLVAKYRFKGSWPTADIFCRGIYIGSELIIVGDVVRLIPTSKASSKDAIEVLKITSIKLVLSNLDKASDNDNDNGHPYNSAIHVKGKSYTLDRNRAYTGSDGEPVPLGNPPQTIRSYGPWYHRQPAGKSTLVPFSSILGRCHEAEAMKLWFPSSSGLLSLSFPSTLQARAFSTSNLRFITAGKSWFWADHRVEALDLETLNGVDVARCDRGRNPKRWRREIKVLEGTAGAEDLSAVRGRIGLKRRRLSAMVRSAIGISEGEGGGSGSGRESARARGKRSRSWGSAGDGSEGGMDGGEEEEERGEDAVMAHPDEVAALPLSDDEMEDGDVEELLRKFRSTK